MTLSKENLAIIQSYGRSILGALIALYLAGVTDPYLYLNALVAALAPVALRYLNKNDIAFGRISGESTPEEVAIEVTKAVKKVQNKPVIKPSPVNKTATSAKKATAKKTTSK